MTVPNAFGAPPFPFTPQEDAVILHGSSDFRSVADNLFVPIAAVRIRFEQLTTQRKKAANFRVSSEEAKAAADMREKGHKWDAIAFRLGRDRASLRRAVIREQAS